MPEGLLIVFEGSEGAGKTTQIQRLSHRLAAAGLESVTLREPGGTPLGDAIRGLLLDAGRVISPAAEALLFMASRAELARTEIDPLLGRGVVVLMDRFFLSTYAYQIAGRGLPEPQVRAANSLAAGGLVPSLTLVIEVPASDGMARAVARGERDRMENSGDEFHFRVENAFAEFTSSDWQDRHPECGRIVSVDGRGSEEEVHARVIDALAQNLPLAFGMLSSNAAG